MPLDVELPPDPDNQDLQVWTDAQLLTSISRQSEQALLEVHRRYWHWAWVLAQRHQNTAPAQAIDDAFLNIWIHAASASRSILPAKLWIIGMLDRSLVRSTRHD